MSEHPAEHPNEPNDASGYQPSLSLGVGHRGESGLSRVVDGQQDWDDEVLLAGSLRQTLLDVREHYAQSSGMAKQEGMASVPWLSGAEQPLDTVEARAQLAQLGISTAPTFDERNGSHDGVSTCQCESAELSPRIIGDVGSKEIRAEQREGWGAISGLMGIAASLSLVVTSFLWGRAEGWNAGWNARTPRIASVESFGVPNEVGMAQLSSLGIPVSCLVSESNRESFVSASEGVAHDFACCTKCHQAAVVDPGRSKPHGVDVIVASCSACHQLDADVCGRDLPLERWQTRCRDCHVEQRSESMKTSLIRGSWKWAAAAVRLECDGEEQAEVLQRTQAYYAVSHRRSGLLSWDAWAPALACCL